MQKIRIGKEMNKMFQGELQGSDIIALLGKRIHDDKRHRYDDHRDHPYHIWIGQLLKMLHFNIPSYS